jgi:hypothetical protein
MYRTLGSLRLILISATRYSKNSQRETANSGGFLYFVVVVKEIILSDDCEWKRLVR